MKSLRILPAAVLLTLAVPGLPIPATAADEAAPGGGGVIPAPAAGLPRPPAAERAEAGRARSEATLAELGLTDAQRDQLREAQRDQLEKLRAVRDDSSLTREQRMAKIRELREAAAATTRSILTEEQYEKWQKSRSSRLSRPGAPGADAPAPPAPDA